MTTAFASPVIGRKIAQWCKDNKAKLPLMKRFFLAGAPSPPQLVEDLASVMEHGQVIIPYGSTEALPISFCDHFDVRRARRERRQEKAPVWASLCPVFRSNCFLFAPLLSTRIRRVSKTVRSAKSAFPARR